MRYCQWKRSAANNRCADVPRNRNFYMPLRVRSTDSFTFGSNPWGTDLHAVEWCQTIAEWGKSPVYACGIFSDSGLVVTVAGDLEGRSTLDQHLPRFRGDWLASASLIAELAEQVTQRCRSGERIKKLTLPSISVDQFGGSVFVNIGEAQDAVCGDISYLPPEQLENQQGCNDPACHAYSLGIIFYSLLCGRAPFSSADPRELQRQIREDLPQPLRQLVHAVPARAEHICLKAIAKKRMDRYATPQALAIDLRKMIADAEDSISLDGSGILVKPAKPTMVNRRTVAVVLCESLLDDKTDTVENAVLFVQSIIAEQLGDCRVRVLGQRLLVDSAAAEGDAFESLLADIVRCLSATMNQLALHGSHSSLDVKVRLAVSTAGLFEEIRPDQLEYSAAGLHASLDRHSIRLTADSKSILRRWLAPGESNHTASVGSSLMAGPEWGELVVARTPFVGRQPQLGILKSRWMQCLEGMGQVVLLIGDEGSGKSSLLSEFVASMSSAAAKMHRISVCCRPPIRGVVFGSISEAFGSSAMSSAMNDPADCDDRSVTDDSKSEAASDMTAPGHLNGPSDHRESVFSSLAKAQFAEAALNRLHALAETAPVLFSVEDIQWADPATLSFLQRIASLGPSDRILTVLTCRSDFETPWGSHPNQSQIALPALSQRQIREMLRIAMDDEQLSDEFVRRVRQITRGLPSLIEGVRDGIIPV